MKGNGKAVPFHFRGGLQAAARIIRPPSAGEFHTCGLRRVISNAHVVENDDQNYFASADAKVCDAWVRWAVSRPEGAKGAGGVRAGRCFALEERKTVSGGGFHFDERRIGRLAGAFLRKIDKKGYLF